MKNRGVNKKNPLQQPLQTTAAKLKVQFNCKEKNNLVGKG